MNTDPKIERIRTVAFFKDADKGALRHLASAADEVDVPAGRTLITEGHNHHEAYVVESGSAEVVINDETVAEIGPGELIGEIGIFSRGTASATVRAKTDMSVLVIPYNRIDGVLDENPKMIRAIAEELAGRLRAMDARHH